jgi:hypothetical protein
MSSVSVIVSCLRGRLKDFAAQNVPITVEDRIEIL